MSDDTDLTRRIAAILGETIEACSEREGSTWIEGQEHAIPRIAALIAEREAAAFSEGQQVANGERRMCVNCGKTVPADRVKPGDELTECIGPYGMAACTFDTTPQEAWEYWSTRWHELHQSLPELRASARREALEEAEMRVKRLCDVARQECCGNGRQYRENEPPDCCGEPDRWITVEQAAAAIRSLAKEATNGQ